MSEKDEMKDGDNIRHNQALQKKMQIEANKSLADRTKTALAVIPIYLIFIFITPCYQDMTTAVLVCGLLLFLSIIYRVLLAKRYDPTKEQAQSSWLSNYCFSTMTMSATWSLFLVATFHQYKTEWVFLLLLLSTAGIASAAVSSLAPSAKLARAYVVILIGPVLVLGFMAQSRPSIAFSVLMCIFLISLMVMIKDNNRLFWNNLTTIEQLNIQKRDLETIIVTISESSDNLKQDAIQLSDISGKMSKGADAVSKDSEQVAYAAADFNTSSKNIAVTMRGLTDRSDQVVTSIEGMTDTVGSISKTTQSTKTIANDAVAQSQRVTRKVSELGRSAQQVGKVTETIKEISDQTNLLALNATIEAARAGESGKGFAVVANEIKELANQTAQATSEIKLQIDRIQKAISETVIEINQISAITSDINESISTSADSVEAQSENTRAIAAFVSETSRDIARISQQVIDSSETADIISSGISDVSKSANEVAQSSAQVNQSTEALMALANALNRIVQTSRDIVGINEK